MEEPWASAQRLKRPLMVKPKLAAGDQCPNQIAAAVFGIFTTSHDRLEAFALGGGWKPAKRLHKEPVETFIRGLVFVTDDRLQRRRATHEQAAELAVVQVQVLRQAALKIAGAIRGAAEEAEDVIAGERTE